MPANKKNTPPPHADSVRVVSIHSTFISGFQRSTATGCHLCVYRKQNASQLHITSVCLLQSVSIQSAMLFLQIVYLFLHYAASGCICPLLPFLFALTGFLSLGGIYMPEASTNETRAYFGALSVTSYSLQPVFSLTRSRKFAASSLLTTSFTAVNPSVLGFCISKEHG